jgi:hypothetical protein
MQSLNLRNKTRMPMMRMKKMIIYRKNWKGSTMRLRKERREIRNMFLRPDHPFEVDKKLLLRLNP